MVKIDMLDKNRYFHLIKAAHHAMNLSGSSGS
jgi:hypothetical protein